MFLSEFSSVQVYQNDNAYSNMINYMKDELLLWDAICKIYMK